MDVDVSGGAVGGGIGCYPVCYGIPDRVLGICWLTGVLLVFGRCDVANPSCLFSYELALFLFSCCCLAYVPFFQ